MVENSFFNQNSDLIAEGYDSEGELPIISDGEHKNSYAEEAIGDDGPPPDEADEAAAPPAAQLAVEQLTVDGVRLLTVARLKDELKRRGRSFTGKKTNCRTG